jgi:endonuclease/exonuclease/phosphatase family metal-dependent hydrolase
VTRTSGTRDWVTFADGARTLPQRANLFADVRAVLPEYQAIFVASDAGPVLDRDGMRHQQNFGLATYVHERVPVVRVRTEFVHGQFTDHAEWPPDGRPRAAQALRLFDRDAGRFLTVAQVHGLRDGRGKQDTPQRREQARRLAMLVSSTREATDLTVVCGDFNLLPDSETFSILADIGLTDLVRDADTRTARYDKPVRHASYLLVSDPAAVRRFEVVAEPEVSDHRPLLLDV